MYVLFITMLTVFTLCEGAPVSVDVEECPELKQCSSHVTGFKELTVRSIAGLSVRKTYDLVCQNYQHFRTCVAERRDGCKDANSLFDVKSLKDILGHVCSNKGREAVSSLKDSPCVKNETALQEAQKDTDSCIFYCLVEIDVDKHDKPPRRFKTNGIDQCSILKKLDNCVDTALTKNCGDSFRSFFRSVWTIYFEPMTEKLECSSHPMMKMHNQLMMKMRSDRMMKMRDMRNMIIPYWRLDPFEEMYPEDLLPI